MSEQIQRSIKRRHVVGGDDAVWVDHQGVVRESDKAKLFRVHDKQVWVPKSVIIDEGPEQLGLAKWWAAKQGIEGDW
jgi:hypothetical protein